MERSLLGQPYRKYKPYISAGMSAVIKISELIFWWMQRRLFLRGSLARHVIIDHKNYPGRIDTWEGKSLSYAPQLYAYKQMVEDSGAGPVVGCYIHLPLLGQLFKISGQNDACE
jgi:hypothetical protein